jgi:tripartite-type tricarboxylate transporter receptor subunit TctC
MYKFNGLSVYYDALLAPVGMGKRDETRHAFSRRSIFTSGSREDFMNKRTHVRRFARIIGAVALLAGLAALCGEAAAAGAAFPRSVSIYIGSGPGGGYDLFGRLIARNIGRFLPGAPTVAAQNMPGAGSVTAANYLFNAAPRDGSALAVLTPSLALLSAVSARGVRFKAGEFSWIGRLASNVSVTFTTKASGVATIEQARARQTLIATIDDTSPLTIVTRVMNRTDGAKFKLIQGYSDSNGTLMAVDRGEAEGATASWNTLNHISRDKLTNHSVNLLVQYTSRRSREMPDVPTALEDATSDENRRIMALYVNGADVGYSLLAPPGLAKDRLDALRAGFDAMTRDPAFLADAKNLDIDLDPMSGRDLESVVAQVANPSPELLAQAKAVAEH